MVLQDITLHLPDSILRRAWQAAQALERPVEEVLATALSAALPDLEDAPADLRPDLARMTWMTDQDLWDLARGSMTVGQQEQLRYLTDLQSQRALNESEAAALEALREEYGRVTLRELAFLAQHTGQDELSLLSQALILGLGMLYRQTVEEAFINENLSRDDAVAAIGAQRVTDIEYAKRALTQDIALGLGL